MTRRVRVLGDGRAGGSFAVALQRAGWTVDCVTARNPAVNAMSADDVDLVLIATSDPAVADVAGQIRPSPVCVVAHCAGSLGLEVLGSHPRVAALHPLVSLPTPEVGAARLVGAWFAVAGDPLVDDVVTALGGRSFAISDGQRVEYHAAACIAANHVVALLGQVERVATAVGVPFEAYVDLARGAVENTAELGPAAALTGPAARGDEITIARHLAALDPSERPAYEAMAAEARRLAGMGARG